MKCVPLRLRPTIVVFLMLCVLGLFCSPVRADDDSPVPKQLEKEIAAKEKELEELNANPNAPSLIGSFVAAGFGGHLLLYTVPAIWHWVQELGHSRHHDRVRNILDQIERADAAVDDIARNIRTVEEFHRRRGWTETQSREYLGRVILEEALRIQGLMRELRRELPLDRRSQDTLPALPSHASTGTPSSLLELATMVRSHYARSNSRCSNLLDDLADSATKFPRSLIFYGGVTATALFVAFKSKSEMSDMKHSYKEEINALRAKLKDAEKKKQREEAPREEWEKTPEGQIAKKGHTHLHGFYVNFRDVLLKHEGEIVKQIMTQIPKGPDQKKRLDQVQQFRDMLHRKTTDPDSKKDFPIHGELVEFLRKELPPIFKQKEYGLYTIPDMQTYLLNQKKYANLKRFPIGQEGNYKAVYERLFHSLFSSNGLFKDAVGYKDGGVPGEHIPLVIDDELLQRMIQDAFLRTNRMEIPEPQPVAPVGMILPKALPGGQKMTKAEPRPVIPLVTPSTFLIPNLGRGP